MLLYFVLKTHTHTHDASPWLVETNINIHFCVHILLWYNNNIILIFWSSSIPHFVINPWMDGLPRRRYLVQFCYYITPFFTSLQPTTPLNVTTHQWYVVNNGWLLGSIGKNIQFWSWLFFTCGPTTSSLFLFVTLFFFELETHTTTHTWDLCLSDTYIQSNHNPLSCVAYIHSPTTIARSLAYAL